MSSRRVIVFKEILEMLKVCAPEASVRKWGDHGFLVIYKNKSYPALPKGKHGVKPDRAEIKIGKVRHMIGLLEIDKECAFHELGLPLGPGGKQEEARQAASIPPSKEKPATQV